MPKSFWLNLQANYEVKLLEIIENQNEGMVCGNGEESTETEMCEG